MLLDLTKLIFVMRKIESFLYDQAQKDQVSRLYCFVTQVACTQPFRTLNRCGLIRLIVKRSHLSKSLPLEENMLVNRAAMSL